MCTAGTEVYSGRRGAVKVNEGIGTLLQMKSFAHQSLESRLVKNVVGQFFVREHGQRGAFGASDHFRRLFNREIRVLPDHRHYHVHHNLQAPDFSRFLLHFVQLRVFQESLLSAIRAPFTVTAYLS
jgi:hypothetical protein